MITEKKIFFWEKVFQIMIISFMLFYGLALVIPEAYYESLTFIISFWILLLIMIISETMFRIRMSYHAFKIKRVGWFLCNFFLGTIFSIIFFFKVFKKEFKTDEED